MGMQGRGREYGWGPLLSDIAPFLLFSVPLLPRRIAAEPLFHPNTQVQGSVSTPPHSGQTAFHRRGLGSSAHVASCILRPITPRSHRARVFWLPTTGGEAAAGRSLGRARAMAQSEQQSAAVRLTAEALHVMAQLFPEVLAQQAANAARSSSYGSPWTLPSATPAAAAQSGQSSGAKGPAGLPQNFPPRDKRHSDGWVQDTWGGLWSRAADPRFQHLLEMCRRASSDSDKRRPVAASPPQDPQLQSQLQEVTALLRQVLAQQQLSERHLEERLMDMERRIDVLGSVICERTEVLLDTLDKIDRLLDR